MDAALLKDELIKKCTWTWTTENDVVGYKVTGSNGNSIFLPAAGYFSSKNSDKGKRGRYLSARINGDGTWASIQTITTGATSMAASGLLSAPFLNKQELLKL